MNKDEILEVTKNLPTWCKRYKKTTERGKIIFVLEKSETGEWLDVTPTAVQSEEERKLLAQIAALEAKLKKQFMEV